MGEPLGEVVPLGLGLGLGFGIWLLIKGTQGL